jgi:hypothetical protein
MSMSLAEALSQVDLETGKTYRCNIKGYVVLVKVLDPLGPTRPVEIDESDLMLEAWTDFPPLEPTFSAPLTPGTLPLDVPDIPRDEDETP